MHFLKDKIRIRTKKSNFVKIARIIVDRDFKPDFKPITKRPTTPKKNLGPPPPKKKIVEILRKIM